jgi:hypothetical protein
MYRRYSSCETAIVLSRITQSEKRSHHTSGRAVGLPVIIIGLMISLYPTSYLQLIVNNNGVLGNYRLDAIDASLRPHYLA